LYVHILQGSGATDLRGGVSFNSGFLHRSFYNWSTLPKLSKKVAYFFRDTG